MVEGVEDGVAVIVEGEVVVIVEVGVGTEGPFMLK